jgi:hypothetical protein
LGQKPLDSILFEYGLSKMKNDTIMVRIFKFFFNLDRDLCLDYYYNKTKADGKPYIEGNSQKRRMEEFFSSNCVDVDKYR